ncbi:hypothetical protein VBH15_09505 [Vagococcus fluvialis]|uniref:hypothetical protein n=1 Tax=Vagococcus fluvialis TaxID=2738 RepID=UPI0022E3E693|nr:hypothetical protein [Vagococcus fluvialis]
MDEEIAELLDFRARSYKLKESNALELKQLLNAIPDEKLKDVVVCDTGGNKLDDVFFSTIGENFQKAIIF